MSDANPDEGKWTFDGAALSTNISSSDPKPAGQVPADQTSDIESTVVRRTKSTKPRPVGAPPRPRTGAPRRPPAGEGVTGAASEAASTPRAYEPYAPSQRLAPGTSAPKPDVFSDPTPTVPRLAPGAPVATPAPVAEVAPAPSVLDRARAGVAAATAAAAAVADKVAASTTSASDSDPVPSKSASRLRRTRRARLRISRIDPWSVMKTSLLFGIAGGIIFVVATYVLMSVVEATGLFAAVNSVVKDVLSSPTDTQAFDITTYINTKRATGLAALIGAIDVVIFTALATVFSFLYNLSATMLGGLEITLAED